MRIPLHRIAIGLAAVTVSLTGSCAKPEVKTPEAQAVVDFKDRVTEYVALHEKLEADIPKVPDKATPEEVDVHQRALAAELKAARADAKPGAFFTPGIQALVKKA